MESRAGETSPVGQNRARTRTQKRRRWSVPAIAIALATALVMSGCVPEEPPAPTTTTTSTPDTTTPDTTTTTEPDSTTTTTPDTTTTTVPDTTTTTIPDPEPEPESDFAFDQPSVMMTEPGDEVTVQLTQFDEDGNETGEDAPDQTTYEVLGDTGEFDVEDLGNGGLKITGSGVVASIVIAARVPGQALAATTEVYVVEPNVGVNVVEPNEILFPAQDMPATVGVDVYRNSFITQAGPGPFSWAEVSSRVFLPENTDPGTGVEDFVDPGAAEFPFVLRGTAPVPGTKLLSGGPNGLAGVVIEPAGKPTIERGGYSLVTIRQISLIDLYAKATWNLDPEELTAAGVVPESYSYEYTCADDVVAEDCETLEAAEVRTNVAAPSGSGGRRVAPIGSDLITTSAATPLAPAAPTQAGLADLLKQCQTKSASSIGELKIAESKLVIHPEAHFRFDIDGANPTTERIFFQTGYHASLGAKVSGKLQASTTREIDCTLKELGAIDIPVPLGPAASALSFQIRGELFFNMSLQVEGGPSAEFEAGCSLTHLLKVGFSVKWGEGGRLSDFQPISTSDVTKKCEKKTPSGLGVNSEGIAAKITFNAMGGMRFPMGFQVGGSLGGKWARALGYPNAGFLDVATIKAGPRITTTRETTARVLQREDSDTRSAVELAAEGELGSQAFARLADGIGLDGAMLSRMMTVKIFEATFPVVSMYEPIKVAGGSLVDLWVDGEPLAPGYASLRPGETLRLRTELEQPVEGPTPTLENARLYVKKSETNFPRLTGVSIPASGMAVDGSFAITKELCDIIGDEEVDVAIIVDSVFNDGAVGWGRLADAYGGSFKAKCLEPEAVFDRDSVDFDSESTTFPATVNIKSQLLGGEEWNIAGVPEWLTVNPATGTFTEGQDEETTPVRLTVNCSVVDPKAKVSGEIVLHAHNSETSETLGDTLAVSADCRDTFLDADPKSFHFSAAGGTATVNIRTKGPHPIILEGAANIPNSGLILAGYSTKAVTIDVSALQPSCKPQGREFSVSFSTRAANPDDGAGRGSFTVNIKQDPPGKKNPCDPPPPPGGSRLDPHMHTFDGGAFDAQTLGEYWYTMPLAGGPDLTVQARHEQFRITGQFSGGTIVTGVAARIDGHLFEWYSRSNVAPLTKLKIDGVVTNLSPGVPVQVGDETSIVLTNTMFGYNFVASSPSGSVNVFRLYGEDIMNVWVTAAERTSLLQGLIGNPDGNLENDLVGRDGTQYTLTNLRKHTEDLLAHATSWRVTDVADSMFSESYGGFDAPVSVFNPADLVPHRAQAMSYLDGIDVVCKVPTGEDLTYAIDSIAVEMLNGTPESALSAVTCGYQIRGTATATLADSSIVAVPGLHVKLSSDRLGTCEATTAANGTYTCKMSPLAPEDLPAEAGLPLQVDVEASWSADGTPIVSNTIDITELAALGGALTTVEHPIDVDPSSLVRTQLSGRVLVDVTGEGDVARTEAFSANVVAYDAEGNELIRLRERVTPGVDGSYWIDRYLPGNTAEVELVSHIASFEADHPSTRFDVEPGANPVTHNIEYRPKLAVVSGTMVNGAGAGLAPFALTVTPLNDTPVSGTARSRTVTPAADGSYRELVVLPNAATTYRVTANIGVVGAEFPTVTSGALVSGANPVTLSSTYHPPVLALSGSLTDFAGASLGNISALVRTYDSSNTLVSSVGVGLIVASDGTYELLRALPKSAVRAEVQFTVNAVTNATVTHTVHDLVAGTNSDTFDHVYNPPRLSLSGVLLDGEGVPRGATTVAVAAYKADGGTLGSRLGGANPHPVTGVYSMDDFVLPFGTERVVVTYRIGAISADWLTFEFAPISVGDNEHVIDIDQRSVKVLVTGTMKVDGVVPGSMPLRVVAYDGATEIFNTQGSYPVNVATGAYSATVEVPRATTRVELIARVGVVQSDWISTELTDVRPGLNQAVFDVNFVPTMLSLSGTLVGIDTNGGPDGPLSSPRYVSYTAMGAGGQELYTSAAQVAVNPTNGAYSALVQVPTATTSVVLRANAGAYYADEPTQTVSGVLANTVNPMVFSVNHRPPALKIAGTVRLGNAPYVGNVVVRVAETFSVGGSTTNDVLVPTDSNGAYSYNRVLRANSVSAVVTVTPQTVPGEAVSTTLNSLQAGWQNVAVNIDNATTRVRVSGYLELFGVSKDGPVQVRMRSYGQNGSEVEPGGRLVTLNADGNNYGRYDETIPLDPATRGVTFIAEVFDPNTGVNAYVSSSSTQITQGQTSVMTWNTKGAYVSVRTLLTRNGVPVTEPVPVTSIIRNHYGDSTSHTMTYAYPDPWGYAELSRFVPFASVANAYQSDPIAVEFEVFGDTESFMHRVNLDDGARIYASSNAIELETVMKEVIAVVPQGDYSEFRFTSLQIPATQGANQFTKQLSVTRIPNDMDNYPWQGGAYVFEVPVSPNATHLELRNEELQISYVVPIPTNGDPIHIEPAYGYTRLTIEGSSRVGNDWACGPASNLPVASEVTLYYTVDDPQNPGSTYVVRREEPIFVIPESDGTYRYYTMVDLDGVHYIDIQLESTGRFPAANSYNGTRLYVDGSEMELSAWLDNVAGCLMIG